MSNILHLKSFMGISFLLLLGMSSLFQLELSPAHGQAAATTVQQPVFGVAVSPDGLMTHSQFAPPGGELFMQRAAVARNQLNEDLQKPSAFRKISLANLQKRVAEHDAKGEPLAEELQRLAGLQRIEFVFALPDQNDIILAGPAQGWLNDADGRVVGMFNRRPVLLLEDLVTALQVFNTGAPRDVWVGCSIGPNPTAMQRLNEFRKTIPRTVARNQEAQVAQSVFNGLEQILGESNVSVFGISSKTHMAKVMIEADYRMKLIAIGREPAPIDMPVFFAKLKSAPADNFQRWWFTPSYKCVEITDDRLSLRISGQGVQLGTEEYKMDAQGRLVQLKSNPLPAAKQFADSFTKRYEQIATLSPVFGQLRVMVDALIVASFIQREQLLDRTSLDLSTLIDSGNVPTETQVACRTAKSVANVKWESGVMIAPSGGVSIMASQTFEPEMLLPVSKTLRQAREAELIIPPDRWWWD
ncbi:MAG: DUF1598 domain-containing protein [Pirellulales bacterium]